jgi:hypothetical protein
MRRNDEPQMSPIEVKIDQSCVVNAAVVARVVADGEGGDVTAASLPPSFPRSTREERFRTRGASAGVA